MKRQISLRSALIFIALGFLIPILVFSALIYNAKTKDIDFVQAEIKGNNYQLKLQSLLHEMINLRMQSLTSATIGEDTISRVEIEVNNTEKALAEIESDLQFDLAGLAARSRDSVYFPTFKKNWQSFVASKGNANAFSKQAIADIRTMITHVGDTSNLILDPDLDSYYLMDATLVALPQTQDRFQEIADYLAGIEKSKAWTFAEKSQLMVYAALLKQSDVDRITGDLQTSLNEDKNFYGPSETLQKVLKPEIDLLNTSYGKVITALGKAAASEAAPAFSDLQKQLQTSIEESFKRSTSYMNELNILLEARRSDLSASRRNQLLISLFLVLVTSTLTWIIGKGVFKDLHHILTQVSSSGEVITEVGGQLTDMAQSLSQQTHKSAATMQQTTATLMELSSIASLNVKQSQEASEVVSKSLESTIVGEKKIRGLIEAMALVSDSSKRIEEISNVIDEIAFQTNLLALNAAVEAARAGEQGKGFAVVAEAVRALATRSAAAAKDINHLIQETVEHVSRGSEEASQSSAALIGIVEAIKKSVEINREITLSADEQASAIEQLSSSSKEIDTSLQMNAEVGDRLDQNTKSLVDQTQQMSDVLTSLKKIVSA